MSPVTSAIREAVSVLRRGGLVAFPTETVYGLGADARNPTAVARIFAVKGRPVSHPLIVHLADAGALHDWAAQVSAEARILAETFWPGPLTLVLPRAEGVLDAVTGGQSTVGLRVPRHPVALELLQSLGSGVAAPSANRFGRVSPTSGEHVLRELGRDVDRILDGGGCEVGLESTIVDCSGDEPALLRPGAITEEALERALGRAVVRRDGGSVRVPGQVPSHYAPRADVRLLELAEIPSVAQRCLDEGKRVGVLSMKTRDLPSGVEPLPLGSDLEEAGRLLYGRLREADEKGLDVLLAVLPPEEGVGCAIADRLRRAAAPRP